MVNIIILAALVLVAAFSVEGEKTVLRIGLMSSHGGSFNSSGVIPVAQIAVDIINNRSDILNNYDIDLVHDINSQCDNLEATNEYFRFWTTVSNVAPIIIGGGCSVASEPVAAMSRYWNTLQISYASSSPRLSNGSIYFNYFRVIPSETHIHKGQVSLVSYFGWERVALVNQYESLFVEDIPLVDDFLKMKLKIDRVDRYQFVSQFPIEGLNQLWKNTPRVIVVNAYLPYTRELLCQAYKNNVYYPAYQFIILGLGTDEALLKGSQEYNSDCSISDIQIALNNVITINERLFPARENWNVTGTSGLTFSELNESYSNLLMEEEYNNLTYTPYALRAFDAVFTAALALNNSLDNLRQMNLSLEDFEFANYTKSAIFAAIIKKNIRELSFQGVLNNVSFQINSSGDIGQSELTIMQYRHTGALVEIGKIDTQLNVRLYVSENTIFPNGIPRDITSTINTILFGVMSVLAVIGMIFAVFCFFFNLLFMKRKYIKLTSPVINMAMCAGAVLLYLDVIILGIPTSDITVKTGLCNATLWIISIGFTLFFGSLIIKTWRIYIIFQNINSGKMKGRIQPPKDWILLIVLLILLFVDLLFLIVTTAIENSRFKAMLQPRISSNQLDLVCKSNAQLPILVVLLIYKSIYLWIGLFLAFEIRKVKIEALNDSKFIAAAVYCTVVICIPLVTVGVLLTSMVEAHYGTLSGGILLATSLILGLIFIPRITGLYKMKGDDSVDGALGFITAKEVPPTNETTLKQIALQQENEKLKSKLEIYETQKDTEVTLPVQETKD